MSRDTYQIIDNVGFERSSGTRWKFVCCDCALTHDVALISEDGKPIGIAMARNKRATTLRRKAKKAAAEADKGQHELR